MKVNQSLITAHYGNNSKVVSTFPLPKIKELLSRLIHCKYFSSWDLHLGYYHIRLTEDAKKKTAFVTTDGKYQWNVVPFGLATAVSIFQYLILQVLTGLNHFTFTYLDDILIFSTSWEEHLGHLNIVFNRFKSASLKIKLSKCQFFQNTITLFRSQDISRKGLELLSKKLDAIKKLAPAKNVDKAHQILGLLGYYWSFAPAFTDITLPITNLLKKNIPCNWPQKCQATIDYLKELFCRKPILQFPDLNKDYILYTNASNNAYSGVLCQPQDNENEIRPVAYFSGTFTAQNKCWCATEKEAYAKDSTTTREVHSSH